MRRRERRPVKSDALTLLQVEHERIEQILRVVEGQVTELDHRRPIDAALLGQALSYLQEFPDACHHPKEDLIAARIGRKHAPAAQLMAEHASLHDLTLRIVEQFQAALGNEDSTLAEDLRGFLAAYRKHLADENAEFFPLALRLLSQEDFDVIDFSVFDAPDPVFDAAQETRFRALSNTILHRDAPQDRS